MSNADDRDHRGRTGNVQKPDPNNAAVDPKAAARQDQVKADHDALQESARRVNSSVSSDVRETPVQPIGRDAGGSSGSAGRVDPDRAATDPQAAATQDQIREDHDRLEESARRVDASVPASVRNTPIRHTEPADRGTTGSSGGTRPSNPMQVTTDTDTSAKQEREKTDHDALEESAKRVKASVPADVRNTPVQPADRKPR